MLLFIIQHVILSLILIIMVHYIYVFLKDNLTQPKIKDLVNQPKAKYDQLYSNSFEYTSSAEKPEKNGGSRKNMKHELQNYLKELATNNKLETTTASNTRETRQPAGISPSQSNTMFTNNFSAI